MKILYATDLHGSNLKYNKVVKAAVSNKVDTVVLGGDLLPFSGSPIKTQLLYLTNLYIFSATLQKDYGINLLFIPGNDDLKIMDRLVFNALPRFYEDNGSIIVNIDHNPIEIDGITFGMSEVPDYPFELKARCRLDTKEEAYLREFQIGNAFFSKNLLENKPKEKYDLNRDLKLIDLPIEKYLSHLKSLPTLESILNSFPIKKWDNCILVTHCPPVQLGLDITSQGHGVGSKAVLEFIEKKQPVFSLHGHIHESPQQSGLWKNTVGKTISIQPGQPFNTKLSYIIINTKTLEAIRYEE